MLGEDVGNFEGAFVGFRVGRRLGENEGDVLGASHNPQRALQLALTSMCFPHLFDFLDAHEHVFVESNDDT